MFNFKFDIYKNRNFLTVILSVILILLIYFVIQSNFLYIFNKKIQDFYFQFNTISISKNIVVVWIDEDTLSWRKDINWNISMKWLWRFPFDRKYYSTVIDNLTNDWAWVIALDIIFWEKSNEESDKLLSDSIKKSWRVVLWLWTDSFWKIQYPYDIIWKNAISYWYFSPNIDKITKLAYSIVPFSSFIWSDKFYDHFSIAILRSFYSYLYKDKDILHLAPISQKEKYILWDKIELIKSKPYKDDLLINYVDNSKFTNVSFLDAYKWNFQKGIFKDKIVIIWATAKWIKDIIHTPIWVEYWVYIHANMVNTILTKSSLKYFNPYLEVLIIFLIITLSVYFNLSRSSYILMFSNISLISITILFILFILLFTDSLLNYPVEFFLSIILSLSVSNIVKYMIENKNKNKLNKALSEYVSKDVAKEILSWDWILNLNWVNKKISIFFSDIEWFTSISEKLSPEKLVFFLREYLSEMSNIIMDEKWFINKYEWDAIMALWWVFWDDKADWYNICNSALKQQEVLKKLNLKWSQEWFNEIKARIWIHIWNAIIWNIWSAWRKMEFTALWDSVNLASRLEWVNKFYWTYICVSEYIYEIQKENFEFRYLDKIRVQWKEKPIQIYELLWYKWKISDEISEIRSLFEKAIDMYTSRYFKWAKEIFLDLIEKWDNASKLYLDMCELYIKNPPSDTWEGVSDMKSK